MIEHGVEQAEVGITVVEFELVALRCGSDPKVILWNRLSL